MSRVLEWGLRAWAVPWTAAATGLALLVLGEVRRRGVILQQDVAGLV